MEPYIISRRIFSEQVFLKEKWRSKCSNQWDRHNESIDPADYVISLISSVIILLIFPILLYWDGEKASSRISKKQIQDDRIGGRKCPLKYPRPSCLRFSSYPRSLQRLSFAVYLSWRAVINIRLRIQTGCHKFCRRSHRSARSDNNISYSSVYRAYWWLFVYLFLYL